MPNIQNTKRTIAGLGAIVALSGHLLLALCAGGFLIIATVVSPLWELYGVALIADLGSKADQRLRAKWHLPIYEESPHRPVPQDSSVAAIAVRPSAVRRDARDREHRRGGPR